MSSTPKRILPILVLAQFSGTSLWFAVNAVMPDLQQQMGWPASAVGRLTSALQLGFIVGTMVFALLAIADRFSSRRVLLLCALAGALCTLGALMQISSFNELLIWRAATGFFLAGIYPVGMKIASQWFPEGLGIALGWLVGALVLGSASAHGIRALAVELHWSTVMISVAVLAAAGGLILFMAIPEPSASAATAKKLEWQAYGLTGVSGPRCWAILAICGSCIRFGCWCHSFWRQSSRVNHCLLLLLGYLELVHWDALGAVGLQSVGAALAWPHFN